MRNGANHPTGGGDMSNLLLPAAGFVGTLLVLGLIAVVVVILVRRAKGRPLSLPSAVGGFVHATVPGAAQSALEVLDQRLATGDIAVEDYLTRKSALLQAEAGAGNEWTPSGAEHAYVVAPAPIQGRPEQP